MAVIDPAAPAEAPLVEPANAGGPLEPPDRGRIGRWMNELRPSVATGGFPALPLVLLAGLNVVDGFDLNAANVLLPEVRNHFGVSIAAIGTVQTLTRFLALALAIPMGYLTDRLNRVWMVGIGGLIVGIMSIATGFAWSFTVYAAFRFGAGLGRVVAPSEQALLADYYPSKVRATVFSFNQMAQRVGQFFGPLLAGWLAAAFVWQVPFVLLSVPSMIVTLWVLFRLKDPIRGAQERREAGASEEVASIAEAPPSWTESWRLTRSVRTMRRLWISLPFTVAAGQVSATLIPLFYEEEFGLGPSARGTLAAIDEPVAIVGLLVGGALANQFLRDRPARAVTYLGFISIISSLASGLVALAPYLPLAVAINLVRAFSFAAFLPTLLAVTTMVIPARVRGFALSATTFFVIPGILAGPILFAFADRVGLRGGLLAMVPIYLVGAIVLASSAPSVEADIRSARAAAMAGQVSRDSGADGESKLLVVRDLDVHYGQVQILFNVDFEVTEGEIVALLGTNGAGKSTLLRAISGSVAPSNGAIFYGGADVTYLPASAHAGIGIVQVPGGKGVFPSLTVGENLKIAAWSFRADEAHVRESTEAVLDRFPVLRERFDEPAGNLSGGEQQMLTLSQAFLSKPTLLMIDELSLGLAPAIVEQLLDIVRDIADEGTTIILVEQSVNVALTISDRAVFMEKGEIRFSGPTADLIARPDILQSVYLKGVGGGSAKARARSAPTAEEPSTALEVCGFAKSFGGISAVRDVSFHLEEGKVLGMIGPNGAGKTTLFDLISGYVPVDEGSVLLFGEDVTDMTPDERARLGLARSFQDARLFPSLTVTENIAVALERHLTNRSTLGAALHLPAVRQAERSLGKRIERLVKLMNLAPLRDKFVSELSTGSRRIVDLACVMACDPRVLLLDEPSAGLAQRETEEMGPLLHRISWETGCCMLIIDHDMPLLSSVCDELLALDLGHPVTRDVPRVVLEHPHVVRSYLGSTEEVINRSGNLN